jgi:hypothetical protein
MLGILVMTATLLLVVVVVIAGSAFVLNLLFGPGLSTSGPGQ